LGKEKRNFGTGMEIRSFGKELWQMGALWRNILERRNPAGINFGYFVLSLRALRKCWGRSKVFS
jgi:hypothetical protein